MDFSMDDFLPAVPHWQSLAAMVEDGATPTLLAHALRWGLPYLRQIGEDRYVGVEAMTFHKGRLWVGDLHTYERAF